jgi:hypothetical protein
MRIATALDRPPSQYFKKWIAYHTQLFDKNDFIFLNFGKSNNELKEYLEDQGFNDIVSLTIIETKHGRRETFDEHLDRYLQAGIESNSSFILHCPLENLVNPDFGIYRQFISESTLVINHLKRRVLTNQHKFIFLDSDELLLCVDLGKAINTIYHSNFNQIVPAGYTIVQSSEEHELDWNIPIYEQRSFWKREPYFYDKPIIVQQDINWGHGRHAHHHDPIPVDENFVLFHMRDVYFNYLYNENLCTKALYPEQPEDHRVGWESKEVFNKWVETRQLELTPIIDEVKVLLKKYNI